MTKLRDRDGEVWTPDDDGTYGALDGTFSGWRRKDIEAQYGPVIEILEPDADPFRHGNRNRRNIYFGAEEHIAVVVGVGEDERSRYLIDALNAHWAAGHRPGEPT